MNQKIGIILLKLLKWLLTAAVSLASCAVVLWMLLGLGLYAGNPASSAQAKAADEFLMDKFDMFMTNQVSDALDGVLAVEKVYWLSDEDMVAPEPNPDCFGVSSDPSELQWLLDDAAELLDGQETLFNTDIEIMKRSEVNYYLDETIFSVTWKQVINRGVYTVSEIKIADPSQFRRFLADGEYGSDKQYLTTQMAASVNAVTASNADFYKHRPYGTIVYNGEVCRANGWVETCYIDDQGEMIFSPRGEITEVEQAEQFVKENNIRFSLAFGPVLVENQENVVPASYPVGEINKEYARAALAQLGPLHYLLVVVSQEEPYYHVPTTKEFADQLVEFGVEKAYSLDGGQTAVIVTNDKLINRPVYGFQRTVSDIIYFATAVPDGG